MRPFSSFPPSSFRLSSFRRKHATACFTPGPDSIAVAVALVLTTACSKPPASGLNLAADSLALTQQITPDTVRSSARNATRLALVADTIVRGSSDSTSVDWLTATTQMAADDQNIVLWSARNIKVFDTAGKHLWSTSRFEFAPGQMRNAKRNALRRGGEGVEEWLDFTFSNTASAPGAVTSVANISLAGDSIVVLQPNNEVSIYSRTGRSIAITFLGSDNSVLVGGLSLSPSPAGWMLLQRSYSDDRSPAAAGVTAYDLRRVSLANGEFGTTLRNMKGETQATVMEGPPGNSGEFASANIRVAARREIIARPLLSAAPQARLVAGNTYWANGLDFSIDVFDEFGRFKRAIIVDAVPAPITQQVRDYYTERVSRTYRTRAAEGDSNATYWISEVLPKIQALPLPKHRPMVGSMWVANNGAIAVRRADLAKIPADSTDSLFIDVIGADGKYRGRVAFEQPGRSIIYFTGDAFYVTEAAGRLALPPIQARTSRGAILGGARELVYQRLVRYRIEREKDFDK